jgi:CIC family chloride channel protein
MGAVVEGTIRAAMTSVFMIFELTRDYAIVVPLMIANLVSFVISRRFQRVPCKRRSRVSTGFICRARRGKRKSKSAVPVQIASSALGLCG